MPHHHRPYLLGSARPGYLATGRDTKQPRGAHNSQHTSDKVTTHRSRSPLTVITELTMVHASMELTRTIYPDNIVRCAISAQEGKIVIGDTETRKIHEQRIPLALSVLELSSLSCLERTGTWTGNGIRIDGYSTALCSLKSSPPRQDVSHDAASKYSAPRHALCVSVVCSPAPQALMFASIIIPSPLPALFHRPASYGGGG